MDDGEPVAWRQLVHVAVARSAAHPVLRRAHVVHVARIEAAGMFARTSSARTMKSSPPLRQEGRDRSHRLVARRRVGRAVLEEAIAYL